MFAIQTRRIHAVVLATLLLLVLGVVGSGQAQAGSCDGRQYSDRSETVCSSTPYKTTQGWVVGYRDSFENTGVNKMTASCTATTSSTVTYSLSLTLGVEAKAWIFAKISASVTGGISWSKATGYSTSTTFDVPRGRTVVCERGVVTQRFAGNRITTVDYKDWRPTVRKTSGWTGFAPSMTRWKTYTL
ncbi:hypothetical protein EDD28_3334 [Salana multivorans]|uniref:Uncharacterized protein n=1 Tax=Salana multivorans TaxID=120377 RepID=A0A3N2D2A7_9MICO|nr:hypothetical protein [Salana multivorans]ROR93905.1 hypothetical protein EDD28_3334 [Salana multivorans]